MVQTIQYITKNKVMETESRELAAVSRGKIIFFMIIFMIITISMCRQNQFSSLSSLSFFRFICPCKAIFIIFIAIITIFWFAGKIRAGHTDDWKSEQLFVPPLPPTNLRWNTICICEQILFEFVRISFKTSWKIIPKPRSPQPTLGEIWFVFVSKYYLNFTNMMCIWLWNINHTRLMLPISGGAIWSGYSTTSL